MTECALVTGGAGFLGRYISEALANEGYEVTVLDNLVCNNSTFDCPQLKHPRITCVEGSSYDRPLLQKYAERSAVIIHFSCLVGVEETISKPLQTMRNLGSTLDLVDMLEPEQIVLFGSSADVYGLHSHLHRGKPMHEDDVVVFEHASLNRWVYPKMKALEENAVENSRARSINIRVFNTYGPAMDFPHGKRLMPQLLDRILRGETLLVSGDGQQRRSLCYYADTIDGMMMAVRWMKGQRPGHTITLNLGHPEPYTVLEIAAIMNEVAVELGLLEEPLPMEMHAEAKLYSQLFDDTWHRVPDISRAREVLGFEPKTTLRDGMRVTLNYYAELTRAQAAAR